MDLVDLAAVTYLAATVVIIAFQVALALGAPWGTYAMGGRFPGRFPTPMRIAALIQAVVLGVLAIIVLSRAGLTAADLTAGAPWLAWIPVVVSAISVAMNAASRSPGERRLWVPVGLVLLASSAVVAFAA